jgi:hypothetical protein
MSHTKVVPLTPIDSGEQETAPKPLTRKNTTSNASIDDIVSTLNTTLASMEKENHPLMISINNPIRASWDVLIIICLVYIFLIVPLEVAFDEPSSIGWKTLGITVDLIFWVDIIICFRTTYFDIHGTGNVSFSLSLSLS